LWPKFGFCASALFAAFLFLGYSYSQIQVQPMSPLQILRNTHWLVRTVLVWFALSIGAAAASPLVSPKFSELICTGSGVMKMLVQNDDGSSTEVVTRMGDCPLCATVGAPPPAPQVIVLQTQPLGYALQPVPAAIIAALTAAPPPARGPPEFS
jgi:Protein of unknown function (DUF2946)